MWATLKKLVWEWRGVLITAPSVTGLIIALRFAGLLQLLEWAAFDQLFRLRPSEPVDPRIVIVGLTEADIQKLGQAILSDATLAEVIEKIKQQQPRAVGLDIYRDLPEEPGHDQLVHVFNSTPNLIGIRKVVGNDGDAPIKPPPVLKKLGQVGANDVILDADSKLRRSFLYLTAEDGEIVPSLGLRLAEIYLQAEGITAKSSVVNPNYLQLGQGVFVPFEKNDGGYVRANAQGYQILLNYKEPPSSFRTVSILEVLEDKVPPNLMRNRIVLIGAIAQSKKDLFLTPYSSRLIGIPEKTAGVEIQAHLTHQIISAALSGRPLIKTWLEPLEWLWILVWSVVAATLSWKWRYIAGIAKFSLRTTVGIGLVVASLFCVCYLAFLGGWWIPLVPPTLAIGGSAIAIASYLARTATDIRQIFSRYLTDEVVAMLLETPEGLKLGGERRKVTILISDLRGFSALSERLPPETVVELLNIYLGTMTDVITQYQGTIDEFIGDAILVLFGAPVQRDDDAKRAIACGVAMQLATASVNEQLERLDLPPVQLGIGINTGEVVVGNIGSKKRAKYAVVGSPINLTSRIESYTVGGQIFISESTREEVGDIIHIQQQKLVQPKGFEQQIPIFEVKGIGGNYNLVLDNPDDVLLPLAEEIPIQYTVVHGKHIGENLFQGSLVKLSAHGAEVQSDCIVEPWSNIKINLLKPGNKTEALYAKVTGKPAKSDRCFYVCFTSVSPDVEALFAAILISANRARK
ncbi:MULTISPECIES: CHASE2 domain-containing protein [unclassified Coleofasciculus]|uniref:CHASE2 domain-containing protein n=1 Tax=unclassified Coleofasciculus TaxID=2692782 RepID=UPI0018822BC2|nr:MULTISPECIES: adenylate/guanylate cyclase domain-containing protein [unclassified Coleofasciculus]MBE9129445.1 adenylate/guanylate cyclase domain-containing protein [Coleofasciculus sp. LEGE 07081]MBE9149651.1 adenylate/guanylate cyclase domain-containing protein [Coleofasciculus sp. LEGE 07092]